ncbi:GNAT family N-acetyltransferase [Geodermatophilus sp. SYSU D01119]
MAGRGAGAAGARAPRRGAVRPVLLGSAPARVEVRPVSPDDVPVLAALLRADREFLAPWEPVRAEDRADEEVQGRVVTRALAEAAADRMLPLVVLADGEVVGRVDVNGVVRGAFRSGDLGYWVASSHNGRGVATAAVALTLRWAFGELGLHRVGAATLLHNARSQRVLARNGFQRIGMAPRYLQIAGEWQDHLLFQRLADADPPPSV